MKRALIILAAFAAIVASTAAQTAFTYQGQLMQSGLPVSGNVNLVFTLYDDPTLTVNHQIGNPITLNNQPLTNGLFTVPLDFGANAFPSARRWVQESVNGTTLSPRQEVTPTPYALNLRLPFAGNASVNGNTFAVTNSFGTGTALYGHNLDNGTGVFGESPNGIGVYGQSDTGYAVYAQSTDGFGVWAEADGTGSGVYAISDSGVGVNAGSNSGIGVYGQSDTGNGVGGQSTGGTAVWAQALGSGYGVYARSDLGSGIYGVSFASNGTGVVGEANNGGNAYGVFGTSANGYGVHASSDTGTGVYAGSNSGIGVYAQSTTGNGVFAVSTSGPAVQAQTSGSGYGVYAISEGGTGIYGVSFAKDRTGVFGEALNGSTANGVFGKSANGNGVYGQTTSGTGVYGHTTSGVGVYGSADGGVGVYNVGVYGFSNVGGDGIYGFNSTGGYAGYFDGKLYATSASSSIKAFRIDHPVDPENKYLQHSSVESPDMMNIYNGNAILGANGETWVELPTYFEALNRDFRYQLTCIGQPALVYIKQEISGNRFLIAGGKKGMKVSWQVTGIRQDPAANLYRIEVEPDKADKDRGKFLVPEAYGQPKESGINPPPNQESTSDKKIENPEVKK